MPARSTDDQLPVPGIPKHAGVWVRFVANLLDLAIMGVPVYLLISLIFGLDLEAEGSLFTIENLLNAVLLTVITVLLWVNWDGRTPGKKLMRIRIVSYPEYRPFSYGTAIIRSLATIVPGVVLPYIVIGFMVALREDKRGYHDMIARTCVVHD